MLKKDIPFKNTLLKIADDCPASVAEEPPLRDKMTEPRAIWEILTREPYTYTWNELIYKIRRDSGRLKVEKFPQENYGIYETSIAKRYGWGIIHNENGYIALVAVESEEYQKLLDNPAIRKIKVGNNKRV